MVDHVPQGLQGIRNVRKLKKYLQLGHSKIAEFTVICIPCSQGLVFHTQTCLMGGLWWVEATKTDKIQHVVLHFVAVYRLGCASSYSAPDLSQCHVSSTGVLKATAKKGVS